MLRLTCDQVVACRATALHALVAACSSRSPWGRSWPRPDRQAIVDLRRLGRLGALARLTD